MVCPITFTESKRNKLGIVTAVLCGVLAFSGILLICLGLFIQVSINNTLILLESYNDGLLPNFLIAVGALMIIINGLAVKFAYDSGFADTAEKFRLALVPLCVVMCILTVVIFAAGITAMAHRSSVESALHEGLLDAMKRYKDNLEVKVRLDKLQMQSRCCGSQSFKDWFKVGWISLEFIDTQNPKVSIALQDGNVFLENVPFSCCDVTNLRPCVTTDVLDHLSRRNYDSVTLYRNGCTDTMMDQFANKILFPTGSVVLTMCVAELLAIILLRYLMTSIQSAIEEGDPEGPGKGYVLPALSQSCKPGDPHKYVKMGALDRMRRKKPKEEEPDSADTTLDTSADMGDTLDTTGGTGDTSGDFGTGGDDDDGGDEGGGGGGGGGLKGKKGKNDKKKGSKKNDKKSKSPKKKSKSPSKKSKSPSKSSKKSPKKSSKKSTKKTKSKKKPSPKPRRTGTSKLQKMRKFKKASKAKKTKQKGGKGGKR